MHDDTRNRRRESSELEAGRHSPLNDLNALDVGVTHNPWEKLRRFTDARIAQGRSGVSLPTRALLEFQLAHAEAIDAVHVPLDIESLQQRLSEMKLEVGMGDALRLHSQASDRMTYLQRPDLGRVLDEESRQRLQSTMDSSQPTIDLALVIVDGLSSRAVQDNAAPFIERLCSILKDGEEDSFSLAALSIVEQGRVAIGDSIGELMNARCVLVMIGERPGLSSPDSLGLYLTWAPQQGLRDSRRNCISNVRPAGLSYDEAAERAVYLLRQARKLNTSGVALKDRRRSPVIDAAEEMQNFLVIHGSRQ